MNLAAKVQIFHDLAMNVRTKIDKNNAEKKQNKNVGFFLCGVANYS